MPAFWDEAVKRPPLFHDSRALDMYSESKEIGIEIRVVDVRRWVIGRVRCADFLIVSCVLRRQEVAVGFYQVCPPPCHGQHQMMICSWSVPDFLLLVPDSLLGVPGLRSGAPSWSQPPAVAGCWILKATTGVGKRCHGRVRTAQAC